MTIGYTSGVFDLLHNGHLKYLWNCKKSCDFLFVGVDCDEFVKKCKGEHRPIQFETDRLRNLQEQKIADFVFIKREHSKKLILFLNPNIYFIPNNKKLDLQKQKYIEEVGVKIISIPYTHGISTTMLLEKLNNEKT